MVLTHCRNQIQQSIISKISLAIFCPSRYFDDPEEAKEAKELAEDVIDLVEEKIRIIKSNKEDVDNED
ncbi:MAG: hypothetical protein ACXADA_06505 [Candidatus Hodarchaeales archaeon]